MSDASEIVCLSDRVMVRRHSLTDQARRGEIGGEEGKPGSSGFQSEEILKVGTAGKTNAEV